ncbi:hypothetical protein [Pseudomonas fragi]|uniref:hypothetical protein n=1 Tax=Pseudomonas fragi TaxID=296 RepID=UPI0016435EDC
MIVFYVGFDAILTPTAEFDCPISKPKDRFSGKSPLSMLTSSSTIGSRQVEEMLFQLAEEFAF